MQADGGVTPDARLHPPGSLTLTRPPSREGLKKGSDRTGEGLKGGSDSDPGQAVEERSDEATIGMTPLHAKAQVPLSRGTEEERSDASGGWERVPGSRFHPPGSLRSPALPQGRAWRRGERRHAGPKSEVRSQKSESSNSGP